MISFSKKTEPKPVQAEPETNRFEQVRKSAADRHKQSVTDGERRRDKQTTEDNRLV